MGNQFGGQVALLGDEGGQAGEVRLAVAGHGDEKDVLAAGGLDLAAGDETPAVGQQDDLDQGGGVEGGSAFMVVLVAGVEGGQVEFVVDQVAQGMLEAARLHLSAKSTGSSFMPLWIGL